MIPHTQAIASINSSAPPSPFPAPLPSFASSPSVQKSTLIPSS